MRHFDYVVLGTWHWDGEILGYLSKIHEFKGRQDLYSRQNPMLIEKLTDAAKAQSIEASNRIEGIVTTSVRIRQLALKKTEPRNRNEQEIAGYRDVLNTIHDSHDYIPLKSSVLLQLHRDLMQYAETGLGGKYKAAQNYIQGMTADGETRIRFTPVSPIETPSCVTSICESYRAAMDSMKVHPLLLIPDFILDFLCIHPFHDGNGRMSRLLTTLLLYQAGYSVVRYISVEKHIEKTKNAYYSALEESSQGWHEGQNDPTPFIKYMLGVILGCYRELESHANKVLGQQTAKRRRAYSIVKDTIEAHIGKFTKMEIVALCPGVGQKSIEGILKILLNEGQIVKMGSGRNTFYVKADVQ